MHQTREILRRKWSLGHSHREVARSPGVSVGAVSAVLERAAEAGLEDLEALTVLSARELEARLYGPAHAQNRRLPDPVCFRNERKDVSLELVHHENLEQCPTGTATRSSASTTAA